MQIRCSIQMGDVQKKIVLVSQTNETPQLLALKLAAYILFLDYNPYLELSAKNPALAGQEFRPDILALDESGAIKLWVECGNTTTNKLDKLIRRYREARIAVLKAYPHETENLRRHLEKNEVLHSHRIEVWSFPEGVFDDWYNALGETVDVVGEHSDRSFNLVMNSVPFCFDFLKA